MKFNVVGQLFKDNNLGQINILSLKSREEISQEHANVSPMLWNQQHPCPGDKSDCYGILTLQI